MGSWRTGWELLYRNSTGPFEFWPFVFWLFYFYFFCGCCFLGIFFGTFLPILKLRYLTFVVIYAIKFLDSDSPPISASRMHILSTLLFFFLLLFFFSFFYSELYTYKTSFLFCYISSTKLICVFVTCICAYICVDSRGQPQVLFLKSHSPYSLRQNLSLVSQKHTIDWLASEPQDSPCL